jgi:hypothetical protein
MRRWKPFSAPGRWLALVLALAFTGGAIAFGMLASSHLAQSPAEWQINLEFYLKLLAFCLLCALAGGTWTRFLQASTLWYGIDRNAVFIASMGNVDLVPLDQIVRLDFGGKVVGLPQPLTQGIGCFWGMAELDEQPVLVRSTMPPSRCLFVVTPRMTYAISPNEVDTFVQDLEQRRNLGTTKQLIPEVSYGPWINTPFWNDGNSKWLLALTLIINLITVGILAWYFPTLPQMVEMRFDAVGGVSEFRPRHHAVFLPLAALAITLTNLFGALIFFQYEKLVSRLLQGASIVVQILFCVAVIMLIRA